jgi:hypothetical protein
MSAIPIRVRDALTAPLAGLFCMAGSLAGPASAAPEPQSRPVLQELACRASAIVVGSVASGKSSVTPAGDSIDTEYAVVVEKTLKPRALAAEIRVRRVGGEVEEGRLRSFRSRLLPPLEVGRRYLIFLAPVAGSDSFAADIPGGTLALEDSGRLSQVDGVGFVRELPRPGAEADYDAVVAAIRGAVERGCPR